MRQWIFLFCLLTIGTLAAEEQFKPQPLKEEAIDTSHTVKIRGKTIPYTATAGTLLLKDDTGKPKASMFYVAYTKDGDEDIADRPITFCFNGGPGSSAIWLHLGVIGPKRIVLNDSGCAVPPYRLVENEHSLLDVTDIVFIDPVSTGYSRAAFGEDSKQFHGLDEDIKWVAEFIRLYTTRNNRWASPKFVLGESYGTTRAAGLVSHLHEKQHMNLNGVILVSSVLNFQTVDDVSGNDLAFALTLPSYTAAAWYHKKLPTDLQLKPLTDVLEEVENFSSDNYTLALMKGDRIEDREKQQVINQLSRYTGLSQSYIENSNMRIDTAHFAKELLRDRKRTVGCYDCRILGIDQDGIGTVRKFDPSSEAISGGFAAALQYYVRSELKWEKDDPYHVIANVWPWNFGDQWSNRYVNLADTLADIMMKNPYLRVFVASGYYDLATPYYAADYTFNHLGLDRAIQKNIIQAYYEGGHMMYTQKPTLTKLGSDLSLFILSTCKQK